MEKHPQYSPQSFNWRLNHVEQPLKSKIHRLLDVQSKMVGILASVAEIQRAIELLTQDKGKSTAAPVQAPNSNPLPLNPFGQIFFWVWKDNETLDLNL
uniref:Uncharacterized protein n=1 Tax=Cucumis sativus TaxID=3659 RepID=A0A0A0KE02_CUCSA